jgi:hypothetical protein
MVRCSVNDSGGGGGAGKLSPFVAWSAYFIPSPPLLLLLLSLAPRLCKVVFCFWQSQDFFLMGVSGRWKEKYEQRILCYVLSSTKPKRAHRSRRKPKSDLVAPKEDITPPAHVLAEGTALSTSSRLGLKRK